jgi:AraC-like DNA-binding protein
VEPNKEHYYIAILGKTMEVYGVQFRPELLRNELEALTKVSPFFDFFYMEPFFRETFDFSMKLTLNQGDQIEFLLMLELLYEESQQKRLGYRLMIQTKLLSMFIYLSRCYDNLDKTADFSSLKDSEIIDRICEFIQKHHAQPLTLQQISRLCGMSQSTFTHRFKEIKGMTFLEYRNQIRCEVAKDLLIKTNHKIISIAQEVGFEDVSNFNKTFKHLVGSSPGEFRKKAALDTV